MAQLQASTVAGTLTTTGNVGIGTTSVSTRLRVNNSSTQYLIYDSSGNLELYTPESQTGYVRLGAAYNLNGVYGSNGFNYIVEPAFNHTFRAQGTALMTVTGGGNVGIGTTNPAFKLDVSGTAKASTGFTVGTSGTYKITTNTDTTLGYLIRAGSWKGTAENTLALAAETGFGISLFTNGSATERMVIDTNGNVGIGTTAPIRDLMIGDLGSVSTATPKTFSLGGTYSNTAGSNVKLKVYDDGSAIGGMSVSSGQMEVNTWSTGKLAFYRGTTQSMIIDTSSNLGIGTAIPAFKLDVSGNAAFGAVGNVIFTKSNGSSYSRFLYSGANSNVIFTGGAGGLGINNYADSARLVQITDAGNVGINTNSPAYKLQVNGNFNAINPMINSEGTSNDQSVMQWRYSDNNDYRLRLKQTVTSGVVRWNFSQTNASTDYNDVLVLDRGSVGIGLTNPSYKLDVNGQTRATAFYAVNDRSQFARGFARLTSANNNTNTLDIDVSDTITSIYSNYYGGGADQPIRIGTYANLTNQLYLATSGNVGIGTAAPRKELDVQGNNLCVAAGQLILGEDAYSTSANYIGLKTSFQSGTEDYMILSGKADGATYVSAKAGSPVYIRGGGNVTTAEIEVTSTYAKTALNLGIGTVPNGTLHIDSGLTGAATYALRTDAASLDYALYVSASGNVAIGGLVPAAQLNHKLVVFSGSIALRGPNDANFSYRLNDTAGINRNALYVSSSNYLNVGNAAFAGLQLFHTGSFSTRYEPNGAFGVDRIYGNSMDNFVLGLPDNWLAVRINNINYLIPMYQ
jgi:hypothetical protein